MKKLLVWLKASNRYKHIIGGAVVALLALSVYGAIYAAVVAASCLEYKDKASGNVWDWADWACTVGGGAIGAAVILLIKILISS